MYKRGGRYNYRYNWRGGNRFPNRDRGGFRSITMNTSNEVVIVVECKVTWQENVHREQFRFQETIDKGEACQETTIRECQSQPIRIWQHLKIEFYDIRIIIIIIIII